MLLLVVLNSPEIGLLRWLQWSNQAQKKSLAGKAIETVRWAPGVSTCRSQDGDLCLKQNRSNKKTYIIQRHNHLVFSSKFFHIFLVNSSFPFSTRNPSRLRGPSRRSLTNGAWRKRPSACAPRRRKPQVPVEDGADGDASHSFFLFFWLFCCFFWARIDFQVWKMMMVIWWWLFGSLAFFLD